MDFFSSMIANVSLFCKRFIRSMQNAQHLVDARGKFRSKCYPTGRIYSLVCWIHWWQYWWRIYGTENQNVFCNREIAKHKTKLNIIVPLTDQQHTALVHLFHHSLNIFLKFKATTIRKKLVLFPLYPSVRSLYIMVDKTGKHFPQTKMHIAMDERQEQTKLWIVTRTKTVVWFKRERCSVYPVCEQNFSKKALRVRKIYIYSTETKSERITKSLGIMKG